MSSDYPPSKKRKHGLEHLDSMRSVDLRFNFYVGAEMYNWSDDCVQRLKELSSDFHSHGYELCRVLHRIYLYYKKMEAEFAAYKTTTGKEKQSCLANDSITESVTGNESPPSPFMQDRSTSLQIYEKETETVEGEEGEVVESGEGRESSFVAGMSTGEQPVERVKKAKEKNPLERNEERGERECSLVVVRRVLPRVPPVVQFKTELRDDREEEERGASDIPTQETESASLQEFPLSSSNGRSSKETPMLQIKSEVNDSPLPLLPDPTTSMQATTPPPLIMTMGPHASPSTQSEHNHIAPFSTYTPTCGVDVSLVAPSIPPLYSFSSPPLPSPPPSSSAVDHSSTSASISIRRTHSTTQNTLHTQQEEISKLIIQVNSIKETALDRGVNLGNLSSPLFSICSDGSPLSMHKLNRECKRIYDEVRLLEMHLDEGGIPDEDYLRVNDSKVREEVEKIWKRVEEQMEKKGKKMRRMERGEEKSSQSIFSIKRKYSKVSRIASKRREIALRIAEKRLRPDSILLAEKKSPLKGRRIEEKREERDKRRSNEEPSTLRGKRHEEMDTRRVDIHWCAFCKRSTSHSAIDCSVYKTFEERKNRRMELNLCFHCLDVYDPPSCNRPEHKRQCPHCHRHETHPSFCRLLLMRSLPHERDSPRSPDGRKSTRKD
ncbi:hypothetical protein PMAYCL1PPCAC_12760 [Pristionchus mayeri]|uniref:Uncharacterized protein n=1 Tax=Pristionchus mayeri TaxID=1317129 RepID=A0AAN4ZRQ9_9BILA|nr:hypothetical protein PMAYCL1PPCAC_12760 [Pristionchus mayeri]